MRSFLRAPVGLHIQRGVPALGLALLTLIGSSVACSDKAVGAWVHIASAGINADRYEVYWIGTKPYQAGPSCAADRALPMVEYYQRLADPAAALGSAPLPTDFATAGFDLHISDGESARLIVLLLAGDQPVGLVDSGTPIAILAERIARYDTTATALTAAHGLQRGTGTDLSVARLRFRSATGIDVRITPDTLADFDQDGTPNAFGDQCPTVARFGKNDCDDMDQSVAPTADLSNTCNPAAPWQDCRFASFPRATCKEVSGGGCRWGIRACEAAPERCDAFPGADRETSCAALQTVVCRVPKGPSCLQPVSEGFVALGGLQTACKLSMAYSDGVRMVARPTEFYYDKGELLTRTPLPEGTEVEASVCKIIISASTATADFDVPGMFVLVDGALPYHVRLEPVPCDNAATQAIVCTAR